MFGSPQTMIALGIGEFAGWLLVFLGQAVGFAIILPIEAIGFAWIIRTNLIRDPDRGLFRRPELLLFFGFFLLEVAGAGVWFQNRVTGIVMVLGGSLAAATWAFERGLMPWPPEL